MMRRLPRGPYLFSSSSHSESFSISRIESSAIGLSRSIWMVTRQFSRVLFGVISDAGSLEQPDRSPAASNSALALRLHFALDLFALAPEPLGGEAKRFKYDLTLVFIETSHA